MSYEDGAQAAREELEKRFAEIRRSPLIRSELMEAADRYAARRALAEHVAACTMSASAPPVTKFGIGGDSAVVIVKCGDGYLCPRAAQLAQEAGEPVRDDPA